MENQQQDKLHHIVVVGGGAGGLELVTRLGNKLGKRKKARITLLDSGLTMQYSLVQALPLLYAPSTPLLSSASKYQPTPQNHL